MKWYIGHTKHHPDTFTKYVTFNGTTTSDRLGIKRQYPLAAFERSDRFNQENDHMCGDRWAEAVADLGNDVHWIPTRREAG
jgi:hypothetical protein